MKKIINKFVDIIHSIVDKIGEKKFYRLLILFFLVCALDQLFVPGIPHGHDMYFHLSRIEGITDGLKDGVFPVLIYPGYLSGYGYANGVFYPDIFLYIPALLHLLGLSTITSYKVLLFITTISIFITMYFTVKKITKSDFVSTMISILYLMSSYRITDMYVRTALGETLTFVFLPLVILGLYELIYGDSKNWKYLTIGLVGVVLSHLLSGLLCILVVAIFGFCNIKKLFKEKDRLKKSLLAGFLAIGITAFFTGPLIEAMVSDKFVYQNYSDGSLLVERAVNPLVTILEIPSRMNPWVPQGIGIVFVYLFYRFIKTKIKDDNQRRFKNICIISGLVLLLASTSLFPWKLFSNIFGMLQFPWRFYILITILLLLGFAILMKEENLSYKKRTSMILILSIFAMFTFTVSTYYTSRAGQYHDVKRHHITWGEYVPIDVDIDKYEERGEVITSNNEVDVEFEKKGTNITVQYENNKEEGTYLELPLLYYNGYVAVFNDGKELELDKGANGVIRVYLSEEKGNFMVYYGITLVRKISFIVSIISLLIFFITCIKKNKSN